jgi:conjugal transfer mating pair stabilization protein TraG
MNLTLHSIGDVAFLSQVLNGIAMLGGTQDLRAAAGLGALVGVLFQALRGLLDPERLGLRPGEFLASCLLWMALFQPTTTVSIEDAYSQEVKVVAHVPLGPAVAGSLISSLGYGLTVLFETAFSVPSMTHQGYAGTLETLTAVRRNLLSRLSIGKALDPTPTQDVSLTVSQYVRDCTLTGVDLGVISIGTLLNTGDLPGAFRFDSDIYVTEVRDGALPLLVTCTEAWPRLMQQVQGDTLPRLTRQLGQFMKRDAGDPTQIIQTSLDTLTQGQVAASHYILAAALVPMFEQGVIGRHQDSLKATEAAMVETAIAQRNSQWAAEQSLFTRIVRPMLTWIEGFSYAITPIMTFTLFLGARGIQMCGQYVLMLIWIQFWMPILAVGNLYITLAAQGGFSALRKADFAIDSVAGLYQMDMELQNWLAIGGMLASATPAIALMLVYGGSVTATHFLGRMQGGDFIDEKVGSPALLQSPALIGMESAHRHTPLTGVSMSGAKEILPTFTLEQDQVASQSKTLAQREQRSEAFIDSLRSQSAQSHGLIDEGGSGRTLSERFGSTGSTTDRLLESRGEALAERYRDAGLSGHEFASLIGGALSGRWSKGSPDGVKKSLTSDLQGGLQAQLQDRFQLGESQAHEIANDLSRQIGHDQGFQLELAQAVQDDASHSTRAIASLGLRSEALSEVGHSAQGLIAADAAYQSALSTQHRSGSEVRLGALEAGMRIESQPVQREALDQSLDAVGLRGDAVRLGTSWQQDGLINDPGQAYSAAGLSLLTGHSQPVFHPLSEDESILAQTLGRTLLGNAFSAPYVGSDMNLNPDPVRFGSLDDFDALKVKVLDALPDSPPVREAVTEAEEERRSDALRRVGDGAHTVTSFAENSHSALKPIADSHREAFHDQVRRSLAPSLDRAAETRSPSEWLDRTAGQFLRAAGTRLSVLSEGGVETFAHILNDGMKEGQSPLEILKTLATEGPERLEGEILRWVGNEARRVEGDLTPAQQRYFKAALLECFAGLPLGGDYQMAFGDLGPARKALDEEAGSKGPAIAAILRKISGGSRNDLLGLLRSYNGRQTEGND